MNRFKNVDDFEPLVGCELIQVCTGQNEVIFIFDKRGYRVSVYNTIELYLDNPYLCTSHQGRPGAEAILGDTVRALFVESESVMRIRFVRGLDLLVRDSSDIYESVVVNFGATTIVV